MEFKLTSEIVFIDNILTEQSFIDISRSLILTKAIELFPQGLQFKT